MRTRTRGIGLDPRRRAPSQRLEAGFTIIEVIVVMALMAVALILFSSTAASSARQRAVTRENLLATDAATSMIERMRSARANQVYALYNSDPADDPGGAGTAPGSLFAVDGLQQAGAPGGMAGEILFPDLDVAAAGAPPDLELREDLVDARFGTPRDLNGDSIIDGNDHAEDYFVLPILVRIRWREQSGDREFRLTSLLCDFNWE